MSQQKMSKVSAAGLLVAMGVVYGDIGTSPLYVMKAIVEENGGLHSLNPDFILGAVSLIFWTLTFLTTIKYVVIALNADNHGEGGIFSLYTLVRKKSKYLIIPAMIGGAALLADGVLTPAVTVTTAIEGLRGIPAFYERFGMDQNIIVIITLIILLILFTVQRFGTDVVGKAFGPVMFLWFTFLGGMGLFHFAQDLSVIRALNPMYAIKLLVSPDNKLGILILGNIFLATTGAEALYSDMGHVGKKNIQVSWPYVKICLLLNYLGQAAWLLSVYQDPKVQAVEQLNPFFQILPASWMIFGVVFATIAAVIASQALLSGSFTLVSEAIKLRLLPRMKIMYPGSSIGQMYIPAVNFILWLACSLIVLTFRTSSHMEAAYGLSITVTMLMTTFLLYFYLAQKRHNNLLAACVSLFFAAIETIFFISSAAKFLHGGFVAVIMALLILAVMIIWEWGNIIQEKASDTVHLKDYIPQLAALRSDESIPMYQTNVVFMVPHVTDDEIGKQFVYSILDKRPKRAQTYWFVNVIVTDEPYTKEFSIDTLGTDFIVVVRLYLGFRVNQEVNVYVRQIIHDLMKDGRLPEQPQRYSLTPGRIVGDFQFVLIEEELSNNTELDKWERQIMQAKLFIKRHTMSPENWFGLEYSDVLYETVPLIIGKMKKTRLIERTK
ncbi:putative potassium transport system protein kup [Enterococcus saigonensis]|uniref:Probable potassium transport system protein Kup n=1 Tax=Enterococcus saigonensis TaxID=1805431 RepID=A0A679IPD9_9ENTE|nr:KUP/HAK/KT family potassium transporter [Enterococcus saigonensis]BCA84857.1 putative potassium transport system protein kup [Enterococcus saigonensis]